MIEKLPLLVATLPLTQRRAFRRIFYVDCVKGELKLTRSMVAQVKVQFGSTGKVRKQDIVKIENLITGESTIYNPLRSLRARNYRYKSIDNIAGSGIPEEDLFAHPLENTPEDLFGRIKGKYCITASNIAKYERYHCVIIFNNADPLDFGCAEVEDYIDTAWRWMKKVNRFNSAAKYGLFLWNCTNRAGASIAHGHAQAIISGGRHYARIEQLRLNAIQYKKRYKSDYFDDLFEVHEALGLGWRQGNIRIINYLTALKQNEVMILGENVDSKLAESVYSVLSGFRDRLQVKSFNLGLIFPPLQAEEGWQGFPLIARVVDRGDVADLSSDIGAMEFYGASVVSNDPFYTAGVLRAVTFDR